MSHSELLAPGNTSRKTFLETLGLMTNNSPGKVNSRFDSLNWEEMVNTKVNGKDVSIQRDPTKGESFLFNSYSGSDVAIYLLFDDGDSFQGIRNFRPFREITTLSVSSARSVHPVRRLGESHVEEYTRGARTIAGSMVCISGDRDPFAKMAAKSLRERSNTSPFFTDELPYFSILIMASDEYGNVSHAALTDLTITNFGQTFSSDDMFLENTYTYVARFYHPLLPDPSVLNHLPKYQGPANKLSTQLYDVWGKDGMPNNVKHFLDKSTYYKLYNNYFGFMPEAQQGEFYEDWAVTQEWLARNQQANQGRP